MSGRSRSKFNGGSHEKYTLNFDGSHKQNNKVGAGCIIRDNQGELVVAAAYNHSDEFSEYCNVAIAEAAALRNGLQLAKDFNIKLHFIKGDSQEVINHVKVMMGCNNATRRSSKKHLKGSKQPLSGIIQQIAGMLDRSHKIELVNRETNQVADKLASFGSSKLQPGHRIFIVDDGDLPPQVAKVIKKERSHSSREEEDEGKGIKVAENIGMLVRGELIKQINEILGHPQNMAFLESRKLDTAYNPNLPPQVCTTPHVSSAVPIDTKTALNKRGTPTEADLKCGHNLPAKLCVSKKEGKRFYGCSLWPKTCGLLVWEDELLKGKSGNKCDELQAKLMEKEQRIAELDAEVRILVDKKKKLELKIGNLEGSVAIMNNELCQMRNEKIKAEKRDKYWAMAGVLLWTLGYFIYTFYS